MAKIRVFSAKAQQNRNRTRKFRVKKRMLQNYEKSVRDEMQRKKSRDFDQMEYPNIIFDDIEETNETVNGDYDKMNNFKDSLKCWTVKHRITRMALNDLLSILIIAGFDFLPKDSRTLMKTPQNVDITNLSNGQLWYHGIKLYIDQLFRNISKDLTITLDFNFDGVPLFNSSKKCFWPIIASIRGKQFCLFYWLPNTRQQTKYAQ